MDTQTQDFLNKIAHQVTIMRDVTAAIVHMTSEDCEAYDISQRVASSNALADNVFCEARRVLKRIEQFETESLRQYIKDNDNV